jgi:hypothetical protein
LFYLYFDFCISDLLFCSDGFPSGILSTCPMCGGAQ